MKSSRITQYVIAAVLLSIGCVALLVHGFIDISNFCFIFSVFVLARRSALFHRVSRREYFNVLAAFLILGVMLICWKLFVPASVGERALHYPAFVIPVWVLMISGLIWRWRRERDLSDAQPLSS